MANQRDMPLHCVCVTAYDRLRSNRIRSFTRLPQDKFIQSSTFVIILLLICYSTQPLSPMTPAHRSVLSNLLPYNSGVTDPSSYMILFVPVIIRWRRYGILYSYLSNILCIVHYIIITIHIPGYNSNLHSPSGHQKCE